MKLAWCSVLSLAGFTVVQAQELPPIASNFDINAWQVNVEVPPSAAPDVVGAFRFICSPSHNLPDDPIVYPGLPGKAHMHTFFGNTMASASSTYQSLRQHGESSCQGGPLNRSAYWMPAMMNGAGNIVMPDYIAIYYKGPPRGASRAPPRGLRFIFGFDASRPTGLLGTNRDGWPEKPKWRCQDSQIKTDTIPQNCAAGQIYVQLTSPECWDGKNLDSANHRSHMAYKKYNNSGQALCPRTHPVIIPQFTLTAVFTQAANGEASDWFLSSDRMPGMTTFPAGSSFHSDWFGAWDDEILNEWNDNCIAKMLSCSAFNLGNGKQGKVPVQFRWAADPRLIAPPQDTTPASAPATPLHNHAARHH